MLKVFFHQFKDNKNIKDVIAKIVRKKKYDHKHQPIFSKNKKEIHKRENLR
jgi:hypothetical protein